MYSPMVTCQPDGPLDITDGSGNNAASDQASLKMGSGSATMHMDAQQAQKHRRFSSDSSEVSKL